MGGSIRVISEVNRGTSFIFKIKVQKVNDYSDFGCQQIDEENYYSNKSESISNRNRPSAFNSYSIEAKFKKELEQ